MAGNPKLLDGWKVKFDLKYTAKFHKTLEDRPQKNIKKNNNAIRLYYKLFFVSTSNWKLFANWRHMSNISPSIIFIVRT